MQFHHHGYVSGDPRVQPAAGVGLDRPDELPDEVDVLIVGAGPAGMIAAAQLSQFPDVTTRIVDRRDGRLAIGQADGIQARSVETFQAFGFAGRIAEEAYRITEMCFWHPDPADPSRIVRGERPADDPGGISEFPHLIVNQARVLDYFAEYMAMRTHADGAGLRLRVPRPRPVRRPRRRDARADRGGAGGAGEGGARQVRPRRRRCPEPGAHRDRLHDGGELGVPRLGRHGRPRRHRLPRHPPQVRDPVGRGREHPAHPARGRPPVPHVRRPGGDGPRRAPRRAQHDDRADHRPRERDPAPVHARRAGRRLAQRLRGRAPAHRPVRRRPAGGVGRAHPSRLHRRRRLPHAQRQGRPGDERVHAGRLQPGVEARVRAVGPQPREPARHLLRRASGGRTEPHRLRQGVVLAHGEDARGARGPRPARRVLRADHGVPLRVHDAVPAVHGRRRAGPPGARHRVPRRASGSSPRPSCASPTRTRCTSGTSTGPTDAGACTRSPTATPPA